MFYSPVHRESKFRRWPTDCVGDKKWMPQVQGLGETTRAPAPRHIFAVVCCVRSTKVQTSLNETSLYRTLYPTLRDTVTPRERKLWRVRLYLCADDNDQLFQQHAAQVAADSPSGLETRLLFIPARSNRVPSREAAEQARLDGRGAHARMRIAHST